MSSPKQPRREADVLAPEDLTGDQKDAMVDLVGYLNKIAEQDVPERQPDEWAEIVPSIDRERRNHVFLLDGARGSGKSAVLLTVLHCLAEVLRGRSIEAYGLPSIERYTIVPVGLIDMQPIDPSTNLLLHLAGQLRRLVDAIRDKLAPGTPRHASELWSGKGEIESVDKWRAFAQAAALSWDARFDERKKTLSPEALAVEIDHIEEERRDLMGSFRAFVDALAGDYRTWKNQKGAHPLVFVIAVDDADMNPNKARELLDLVRSLWHPRVAFVLTGDSKLFENVLQRSMGLDDEFAVSLPRDVYDKVIPRAHRLELPGLPRADRVARLLGALASNDIAGQLRALLEEDDFRAEAIPDRLRHIHDLALVLQSATPTFPHLLQAWRSFLAAHDGKDAIWYSSHLDDATGRLWFIGDRSWTLARNRFIEIETQPGIRLQVGTSLFPTSSSRAAQEPVAESASRVAYRRADSLALLAQAAQRAGALIHVNMAPPGHAHWVLVDIQQSGGNFWVAWRLPRWSDFERTLRATRSWQRRILARLDEPAALGAMYLAAVLEGSGRIDDSFAVIDAHGEIQWADLAKHVATLARQDESPELATWALEDAPLLAAPESGLPADAANAWLDAYGKEMQKRSDWKQLLAGVRQARTAPGRIQKGRVSDFASLDARFHAHAFRSLIEIGEPKPWYETKLHQQLRQLRVVNLLQRATGKTERKSVADQYVHGDRIHALSLSPELDAKLAAIAVSHEKVEGLEQKAMYELWKCAAEHFEVDPSPVRFENGRLDFHLEAAYPAGEEEVYSLGDTGELVIGKAGPLKLDGDLEHLPRPLDALLRMAFDVMADARDDEETDRLSLRYALPWTLLALRREGHEPIRLPVPRWRALIDYEVFMAAWDRCLDLVLQNLRSTPDQEMNRKACVGLLYWYIEATHHVFAGRSAGQKVSLDRPTEDWKELGNRLREPVAAALQIPARDLTPETMESRLAAMMDRPQRSARYLRWVQELIDRTSVLARTNELLKAMMAFNRRFLEGDPNAGWQ